MPQIEHRPKKHLYSRLFLLAYGLIVGWAVYHYMILPSGSFKWDQAAHSVIGTLIAQDLIDGSWLAFFYDLYRQVYWPPMHPLLLGVSFTIGGISPVVARSLSLLLFLGSAFLVYVAGYRIGRERGHWTGFIAVVLFLTSPGLLPFAAQVMLEMTAVFFLVLSFLLFFEANERSSSWLRLVLGLAVVATYLAKSNYGILLIITLAVELLIEARFQPRKIFSKANLFMALPIIVAFAIWFAYPPKIAKTWEALVNIPFGVSDPYSLEGLLFYPKALWQSAGLFLLLILYLTSLILVLIKYRNRNLRFLALLIIIQLLAAELHQTKVERHILPVLPAFFLLTGYGLAYEGFDIKIGGRQIRFSLLVSVAALLYSQVLLVNALKPIAPRTELAVINMVTANLADQRPSLVLTTINQSNPTPPLLDWSLIAGKPALNPVHSDIAMNYDQDNAIASLAMRDRVPNWLSSAVLPIVQRQNAPGFLRTVYLDNSSSSYSQNPQALSRYLQELNNNAKVERVIVVVPNDLENSFVPAGTSPFKSSFYVPALNKLGLEQTTTRVFEAENTRVEVYEASLTAQ